MVTFEEAKGIAQKAKSHFDTCLEYDKGYRFFDSKLDADGDAGVVVIKESGKAVDFVSFIMDYRPNPKFKKIPIGTKVRE